jgi:hypothetical protein
MHGRNEKFIHIRSHKTRDHLEDLGVDGRTVLKLVLNEEGRGVD